MKDNYFPKYTETSVFCFFCFVFNHTLQFFMSFTAGFSYLLLLLTCYVG